MRSLVVALTLGFVLGLATLIARESGFVLAGILGAIAIVSWVRRRQWSEIGLLLVGAGAAWAVILGRVVLLAVNPTYVVDPINRVYLGVAALVVGIGAVIAIVGSRRIRGHGH